MIFTRRDPIILLIAGRARSGKGLVGKFIEDYYVEKKKKVIDSGYTKYLKMYIENITGVVIDDNNKPRELLQKLSSLLIKKELSRPDFFIKRQLEDLEIYSYFADVIIISDVRFKEEIEVVREKFRNVISIGVVRPNYCSDLTDEQKNDVTETALDGYDEYDYKIVNIEQEKLKEEVFRILDTLKKEGIYNE